MGSVLRLDLLTGGLCLTGGAYAACPSVAARVESWALRRDGAGQTGVKGPPGARARLHRHGRFHRSIRAVVRMHQAGHNWGRMAACKALLQEERHTLILGSLLLHPSGGINLWSKKQNTSRFPSLKAAAMRCVPSMACPTARSRYRCLLWMRRRRSSLLLFRFLLRNVDTEMPLLLSKETPPCLWLTKNTGTLTRMI